MTPKTLISNWQIIILIIFANTSAAFIFVPTELTNIVNQDAWIPFIPATFFVALLLFYPLAKLGMKYPGKTIIQYSEDILGKFFGKIFGILLIYYFFQVQCWSIREYSLIASIFLKETPELVFYVIFSFLTAYAVFHGIEVISRCSEIIFLIGIVTLVIIGFLNIDNIKYANIQPVMESGMLPLLRATLVSIEWLATGFVFCVLASFINDHTKLNNIALIAIGLAGSILTIFSIINLVVFPSQSLNIINFPLLALARNTKVPVIERIEILVIIIWGTWIFIRAALFSYATVLSISQLFKLSNYHFLILPETILAIAYSYFQYDSFNEFSYLTGNGHLYYLIFSFGLPFTLWIVSLVRSKLR